MKFYSYLRRAAAWVVQRLAWAMVLKSAVVVIGFAALAYVGSGAAKRLTTGPAPGLATAAAAERAVPASAMLATEKRAPEKTAVTQSEITSAASASSSCKPKAPSGAYTEDGKLILNLATADDLVKLPRIGAKRAQAIVDLRTKLGRFRRVRDLLRIRGIGYRLLQKIKPLVVVDPPKARS